MLRGIWRLRGMIEGSTYLHSANDLYDNLELEKG
jgi:hypothetical protein